MLENIDLSKTIEKKDYKKTITELEKRLSEFQREAKELNIPIIIVFEGWGASGKGTLINKLILPLDPRGFCVYTTNYLNIDEIMRPFLWRFWVKTPLKGRMAIFDKSWYRKVMVERVDNQTEGLEINNHFEDINSFEKQLSDDGNVVIKFFLHISKKEQRKRFEELESDDSTSWRVTKDDWKHHQQYEEYIKAIEEMIEKTDKKYAPWNILEANDNNFATVKAFEIIIKRLEEEIESIKNSSQEDKEIYKVTGIEVTSDISILKTIDLSRSLSKEEYKTELDKYQKKIQEIQYKMYIKRVPVIIVYEGWDAAGKGGNIKRITEDLDPRGYEVIPIAAPTDIEKAHHYLWRFWSGVPKAGHFAIFDRSWYGRVLVERVEGFCSQNQWKRAYNEINEMEKQFSNFGIVVVKFWLHIDKEEQLKRLLKRKATPEKQWKITDEDWRNRDKWDSYEVAAEEMLLRTSSSHCPWTIIEANDKYYARIKAMKTIIEAVEKKL